VYERSFLGRTFTSGARRGARGGRGAARDHEVREILAVCSPTIVRNENSRVRDSSRPAGSSTFSAAHCVLDVRDR